jgi:hypothetical protein
MTATLALAKQVQAEIQRLVAGEGLPAQFAPVIKIETLLELAPDAKAKLAAQTRDAAKTSAEAWAEEMSRLDKTVPGARAVEQPRKTAGGVPGVVDPTAISEAEQAIRKYIQAIDAKNAAVAAGDVAGDVLNAQLQLEAKFAELSKDKQNELTKALIAAIQKRHELAQAQAAQQGLQSMLTGLANEKQRLEELLGVRAKLNAEQRAAATVEQTVAMALAANIPITENMVKVYKDWVLQIEKLRDKATDQAQQQLRDVPQTFAEGWNQATEQFDTSAKRIGILGGQTADALLNSFNVQFFDPMTGKFLALEDIARQVLSNIINAITQIATQQIAMAIFGPIKFAKGGALDRGAVRYAQHGMVIDQPTVVGAAGGMPVVGGEAGTEVVMPVARTPSGDLGVKVTGGGGGQQIRHPATTRGRSRRPCGTASRACRTGSSGR